MRPLWEAFKQAPSYLFFFVLALLVAMLTDGIVTALTIGAITLGVLTNVLTAISVFCLVYVVIRTINTVANAIGSSGHRIAQIMSQQAMTEVKHVLTKESDA